jgi:hypothetical protein
MKAIASVISVVLALYIALAAIAYFKQGTLWCGVLPDNVLEQNYRAQCWNGSLFR